jgi:glycosyltransferase involved in cell wall biosynthesis
MSAEGPLVTLIVPAYNAERYIARTMHSLLAQTYRHLEVVVIDDGSTDGTADVVESIREQDPRVVLIQQPNRGVAAARNAGVSRASGEFIAPVDADDLWFPTAVERLEACLRDQGPDVGLVYAWSVYIDEHDRLTGGFRAATIEGNVFATMLCHNFLGNASCTMIRRDCLDVVAGYDSGFREHSEQGCEDWDFYLRLSERYRFCVVPDFLIAYRKVTGRMSCNAKRMAQSQNYMLCRVYTRHPQLPRFLSQLSRSSFYLYLAQQGGKRSRRAWLKRAFFTAPWHCLLRPRFHQLWSADLLSPNGPPESTAPPLAAEDPAVTLDMIQGRKYRLYAMLIGQRVFHSLISMCCGAGSLRAGILVGDAGRGAPHR